MNGNTFALGGDSIKTSTLIKTINRFSSLHREEIRKIMSEEGLHFGQHPIMWDLLTHDSLTQVELARHLGVSAVSINNSVRRLANKGFVVKTADSTDLRKSHIFLTDKGRETATRCQSKFQQLDQKLFQGMSDNELETLYASFHKMIQNLE